MTLSFSFCPPGQFREQRKPCNAVIDCFQDNTTNLSSETESKAGVRKTGPFRYRDSYRIKRSAGRCRRNGVTDVTRAHVVSVGQRRDRIGKSFTYCPAGRVSRARITDEKTIRRGRATDKPETFGSSSRADGRHPLVVNVRDRPTGERSP